MVWIAILFIAAVGIGVILGSKPLARMQAAVAGGTIVPGCVVAQGAALLILAIVLFLLYRAGAMS